MLNQIMVERSVRERLIREKLEREFNDVLS